MIRVPTHRRPTHPPLLQVGVDHGDQLIRGIGVERAGIIAGIDQVGADVVLDHLGHQAGDAAANPGNHMHDALAVGLFAQRPLDGIDLAANPADAGEQLSLFTDRVGHRHQIGYPPILCQVSRRDVGPLGRC